MVRNDTGRIGRRLRAMARTACLLRAGGWLGVAAEPTGAVVEGENGRIAFNRSGDIFAMGAQGETKKKTAKNLTRNTDFDGRPVWSPDGTRIAFSDYVGNKGDNSEVFVMDANETNLLNLTDNPAFDAGEVWSPDGTKIAFRSNRDGNAEIYVVDTTGANLVNLTDDPAEDGSDGFAWSPDGTQIASQREMVGVGAEIWVMDAAGGSPTQLTPSTDDFVGDGDPVWSPDGTKIALARHGPKLSFWQTRIYVVGANGRNLKQLSRGRYDIAPDWQAKP